MAVAEFLDGPTVGMMTRVQLQDALIEDDNWTGKTDPAERRKRQNRLHQRAWRRRQKLQHGSVSQSLPSHACQDSASELVKQIPSPNYRGISLQQLLEDHVSGRQRMPVDFKLPQSRLALWTVLEKLGEPQSTFAYWAELRAQRKREIASTLLLEHFPSQALQPYLTDDNDILRRQCKLASNFPLSADHQLFVLIQHNSLRGVMANMSIILQLNGRPFQGWADFYTEDLPAPPDNCPASLRPTILQKSTPHESWVDIIPYATLRDNIIKNQDILDADELCDDFLGGMYEGVSEVQSRGMVLWGQPWSGDGWEVSDGFVRKWEFLLKGCDDLIKSTNRWREVRGDEPLIVEI